MSFIGKKDIKKLVNRTKNSMQKRTRKLDYMEKRKLFGNAMFTYLCTPPRSPRISRLKSQIMKPTFLS